MAILSLLFSFLGRKIGDLVQAIFGWSITALFGKLPGGKSLAVTVALALSIAWPIFVVGLFFPAVAAWVLAFAPIHDLEKSHVLRIVWGVLAVILPPIVGLLTRWAAPHAKGTALRSAISGYPLAIGFFLSFVVTAVTVPIVKVFSLVRGWVDTHVHVQPREGRYRAVLGELAEACARAGILCEVVPPPRRMTIATELLRVIARSAVSPILAEELLMLKAPGIELTLYPADLLLRGDAKKVAQVRAMMTRTELDADAYLVSTSAGQAIQDELGRLVSVVREHEAKGNRVAKMATKRLIEIWHEMNKATLEYEDWIMLESIARRLERRIATRHHDAPPSPLDQEQDELENVAKKANAAAFEGDPAPLSLRHA